MCLQGAAHSLTNAALCLSAVLLVMQERKDLFGAPYDFRLAADGLVQVTGSCTAVSPVCND